MWQWIVAAGVLVALVILMPLAVGAMRNSQRRSGGSGIGAALLDMQAFIAPSTEHLIEARKDKVVETAGDADSNRR